MTSDLTDLRRNPASHMIWKSLRTHKSLENGLELGWSEVIMVWDGVISDCFCVDRACSRWTPLRTKKATIMIFKPICKNFVL